MSADVRTPHDRFIRLPEVQALTGRRKTAIYSDPAFPRPVKMSERASGWLESEVLAWMAARVEASRRPKPEQPPATAKRQPAARAPAKSKQRKSRR